MAVKTARASVFSKFTNSFPQTLKTCKNSPYRARLAQHYQRQLNKRPWPFSHCLFTRPENITGQCGLQNKSRQITADSENKAKIARTLTHSAHKISYQNIYITRNIYSFTHFYTSYGTKNATPLPPHHSRHFLIKMKIIKKQMKQYIHNNYHTQARPTNA